MQPTHISGMRPTSLYMKLAKQNTSAGAKFNLTSSGLHVHASEFSDDPSLFDDTEHPYGYPPVIDHISRHSGVNKDRIFTVTGGTSMANFMVFEALIAPGDEVVIEAPSYPLLNDLATWKLGHWATAKRAQVHDIDRKPENNFEIDLNSLEQTVKATTNLKLIVLTNLHNPSGCLTAPPIFKAVGEIARRKGAYVLVDEVYLDAARATEATTAALCGDEFIVTSSLNKVYGLGFLRAGWILAEPQLIQRLWSLYDVVGVVPPTVNDRLVKAAWDRLPDFYNRSVQILDRNHELWEQFVAARRDVITPSCKFGTTAFPTLDGATEETINCLETYLLDKYETGIVAGSWFRAPRHFRISLCCETEMLRSGLERLGKALDERKNWDR